MHEVDILAPQRDNTPTTKKVIRYNSIRRLLISGKYDVIKGESPPITHTFFAFLTSKIMRTPFIIDTKDIFSFTMSKIGSASRRKMIMYRLMERIVYRNADQRWFVTEADKKMVTKMYGGGCDDYYY